MQFIDLKTQQLEIREKIDQRINKILDHGKYIMGPEVYELEERLADYVDVKYCISCSSGTDALLIPLLAMDIGPGDAVITTPFTYIATAEARTTSRAPHDQDLAARPTSRARGAARCGVSRAQQGLGLLPVI